MGQQNICETCHQAIELKDTPSGKAWWHIDLAIDLGHSATQKSRTMVEPKSSAEKRRATCRAENAKIDSVEATRGDGVIRFPCRVCGEQVRAANREGGVWVHRSPKQEYDHAADPDDPMTGPIHLHEDFSVSTLDNAVEEMTHQQSWRDRIQEMTGAISDAVIYLTSCCDLEFAGEGVKGAARILIHRLRRNGRKEPSWFRCEFEKTCWRERL